IDPARQSPLECAASFFNHIHLPRFCHEGPVLPEVGEGPSPRLQGGPPSWQGLRDLQVQPAFQGAPALRNKPEWSKRASAENCSQVVMKAAARRLSSFPDCRNPAIAARSRIRHRIRAHHRHGSAAMNRLSRSILAAAFVASPGIALAQDAGAREVVGDTLLIERVREEPGNLPARGMSMAQVEAKFGAPRDRLDPRGGQKRAWPTINRWTYPAF